MGVSVDDSGVPGSDDQGIAKYGDRATLRKAP
jgi:hypothetical protein